jgi:23S rRNA pseudouridine2604 synthase
MQPRHHVLPTSLASIEATSSLSFSSQSRPFRRNNINSNTNTRTAADSVRLSKRMSELGICSRREAAKILKDTTNSKDLTLCEQAIYLRGEPVTAGTGVKVPHDEKMIEIRSVDEMALDAPDNATSANFVSYDKLPWEKIKHDTIVLHKPVGYVSGQEEHQHVPAVRLLTPSNFYSDEDTAASSEAILNEFGFKFTRKKWDGFDIEKSSVPKHIKNQLGVKKGDNSNKEVINEERTLSGYAPAGRLDIDSTGLLIFTRAGIMARQLIAPDTTIPKEVSYTFERCA